MKFSAKSQVSKKEISAAKAALTSVIYSLPRNSVKFLNIVIAYRALGRAPNKKQDSYDRYLYASQKTIARWCGCCEKTINRAVYLFESLGMLEVSRYPYRTNSYSIPGWFYNWEIQQVLKKVFSSIQKLYTTNVRLLRFSSPKVVNYRSSSLGKRADFFKKQTKKKIEEIPLEEKLAVWKFFEESVPIEVKNPVNWWEKG
jgi:hypothetical protein